MRRREFHGHPDYLVLTEDELELHSAKNQDYTKGGDSLGNFRREAIIFSLYPGLNLGDPAVVAIVNAMKQMDAAMWMLSHGYEGEVETIDKRLRDTHIYLKIARVLRRAQPSYWHKA